MKLGKALKKLEAHVWEREANEHYVEPDWCSRRLFEEEDFRPAIWHPCAGWGRIPEEAAKQGLKAHATDIVDRGYSAFDGVQNFLTATATRAPVIVCNPPFAIASHFAAKALSLEGVEQVAMIFPTARLNAAHWLRDTPLARVWLMTSRPSMPHFPCCGLPIRPSHLDDAGLAVDASGKALTAVRPNSFAKRTMSAESSPAKTGAGGQLTSAEILSNDSLEHRQAWAGRPIGPPCPRAVRRLSPRKLARRPRRILPLGS